MNSMKEIRKHIKEKSYAKVYLLLGDEEYLVSQARMLLQKALTTGPDDMNYKVYNDGKVDLSELDQLASTYPFFSEKRLILIDRMGILKTGKDELVKIMEDMPDTTCLVICESEADKRSKVYKWIKKNGYIGEFYKKDQNDRSLTRFIAVLLSKVGIQIRESDAYYMLSLIGSDMYQIKNETDKLIAYMGEEKTVSTEMIEAVVFGEVQNKIFDMVSAIAEGRKKQAIVLYNDLLTLREAPAHMLALIIRQYRLLLIIKDMRNQRRPDSEIASVAGIAPFIIRKYEGQLRLYNSRQLRECYGECLRADQSYKEGRMIDQIALESLIIKLIEHNK